MTKIYIYIYICFCFFSQTLCISSACLKRLIWGELASQFLVIVSLSLGFWVLTLLCGREVTSEGWQMGVDFLWCYQTGA